MLVLCPAWCEGTGRRGGIRTSSRRDQPGVALGRNWEPNSGADFAHLSFAFQTFILSFLNYTIAVWTADRGQLKLLAFPALSSDYSGSHFLDARREIKVRERYWTLFILTDLLH